MPSPMATTALPRPVETELPPAEATAAEAERTFRKLEEDQQQQMMEMTPLPPDVPGDAKN